jgi:hypothetical protein
LADDKRGKVLDGLARLYPVRPYRASEDFKENDPPETLVAVEVYPQHN